MKKLLMIALLISACNFLNAQDKQFTNLLLFYPKQIEKAKVEIDKLMTDPKAQAKAEGWLWKSRIYAELYFDSAFLAKYPGSGNIAFEAFQKYESMDPSYKLVAEPLSAWRSVNLIYVSAFNIGKGFFAGKEWDSSLAYFSQAAYMGEIIVKNDLRKNGATLDTLTAIYAGYSAQNAKKGDEAVKYYTRLADNRVGGDDYKDVYTYLLVHFADKKDAVSFNKYLAVSKELYPKGDWDDYEVDFLNKAYTLAQKVELYDKEDAAGTFTARKYLLFGQMFSDLPKEDKAALDSSKTAFYQNKAIDAFKKAYNKDNTLGIAAFNAGVVLYNQFGEYDDRYRAGIKALQDLNSNKPVEKDPKKKAAADAKFKEQTDAYKKLNAETDKDMIAAGDMAIDWLEKSYNAMKDIPKKDKTTIMCLNRAVDYLASVYEYKKNKVKGKDLKAFDAYEAKFKFYDGLHGSFK